MLVSANKPDKLGCTPTASNNWQAGTAANEFVENSSEDQSIGFGEPICSFCFVEYERPRLYISERLWENASSESKEEARKNEIH